MSILDWFKKRKAEDKPIEQKNYEISISSHNTDELIHETFENSSVNDEIVIPPAVTIDPSEYDAADIVSTFQYAMLKYGESISKEPDRLKNIMSDLAPLLGREIKLLNLLCKNGNIVKAMDSSKWADADLYLWIDNATNYLVQEEFIDKKIAYSFARKILIGISGRAISDKYIEELLAQEKAETEELRKKEAAKARAAKAAETRRKNAEAAKAKELEELKRKLEEEEKARKAAEAKAAAEQTAREKERKEAAQRIEQEKKKREAAEDIERIIRQLRTNTVSSGISINYSERATAQTLFNKYNGKIDGNVIVVAEDWTGDFCFVIDEIVRKNGLKARGTLYKDGDFYKNYSYPADDYLFHMYNGPSKNQINRVHVRRDADPTATVVTKTTAPKKATTKKATSQSTSSNSRFKDGRTLKEFFENNGFEVIDKRYNNGCLWVVGDRKKLDPYIELARAKFGSTCTGDFASGRATNYRMAWWTKCSK